MSTQQQSAARKKTVQRWVVAIAAAIAAVVLIVVIVNGATRGDDSTPVAGATRSPNPTASPTATTAPSASPTATPSPGETAPPPAEGVQPTPPPTQEPVALTQPAAPVPGVVFSIANLEAVEGVANGPGEVAGPALRFTVTVRNDTAEPVSLTYTIVNLYAGPEHAPATEVEEPGGVPFPASVEPGATASGVFVFTVAPELRDQVQISVDYTADAPTLLFEGPAPR